MQAAGVSPLDVSYVELHGTGTQAGDAVESESVADIFAPLTPARREKLKLGAVKSNIGHGEAAAGITSLIKVLLAFEKQEIPRHVGIRTEINPVVMQNMQDRNAGLVMDRTAWPRPENKKRYAIVNSFGAHGGNTTILLEDAPRKPVIAAKSQTAYAIALSAKSKVSLRKNIKALLKFMDVHPEVSLGDLSYTTCARRMHHGTRIATSITSKAQLRSFLESSTEGVDSLRPIPVTAPTVAFAFTGQGAFYQGMGAQLFRDFPFFRDQVIQLDRLCQHLGFPRVVPAIEDKQESHDVSSIVTQLTILVLEIALVKFWELLGIRPSIVIGHSLGEYAALVAAGVISAADAIYLVGRRAELLVATCKPGSHVMLSVRSGIDMIQKLAGDHVYAYEVSCLNDHNSTVISGMREEIEAIQSVLEASDIKCMQLDLPYAFHSAQIDPILEEFENIAKHITFHPPQLPIISPLLAKCVFDSNTVDARYLSRASREKVNYIGALDAARELGITEKSVWLEIGPHPLSASFVRAHDSGANVVESLRRSEDNNVTLTRTMAKMHCEGLPVCWNEYFKPNEHAYNVLRLSAYQWNDKNHWIQYEGTWALDKAIPNGGQKARPTGQPLNSASVQQIVSQKISDSNVEVVAVTDVKRSDILDAVLGHTINGVGVVTAVSFILPFQRILTILTRSEQSIWTDMALTLGSYLYKKDSSSKEDPLMNVTNMSVQHAQKIKQEAVGPQLLHIEATLDRATSTAEIAWYNLSTDGQRSKESFATATIIYESSTRWKKEWHRQSHLLNSRINSLQKMASTGTANRLSTSMIYNLFRNIVDYSPRYQGMQSVVLNQYEACAEIVLSADKHGEWHTPPHWIDSLFQLAGFVMNGSDATNTKEFVYLTPGWTDLRCIEKFEAGVKYQSYVRMVPDESDPNTFLGDLYVLRGEQIVGMLGEIKFRRMPRAVMGTLFNAHAAATGRNASPEKACALQPASPSVPRSAMRLAVEKSKSKISPAPVPEATMITVPPPAPSSASTATNDEPSIITDCVKLIAQEAGYPISHLTDESSFAELGVDSLMSLVLSEKFRSELGLEVKSSLFLECPTVKEFKNWLKEYC
jgi:asperthecin polyketide synthase